MSFSGLLGRVDDWINPIVVKELRQAVKSRMVVSILMLFLGVQLFLLGCFLLFGELGNPDGAETWNAGNLVFCWQQGILLWTLMLLVPAYAAIRLGSERSDNNVDLLFISTLKPRSIVSGKFFAALVLAILVFSTCAPFMTFTYLLRGIDIPTILTVLGIDLLAMLLSTMFALFVAAVPGARALKLFFGVICFLFLAIICGYTTAGTLALVMQGTAFFEGIFNLWLVLAVVVAATLGLVGLLFVYSVALISPPSSNRILPVRLYLVGLWLLLGVGLFLTSFYHRPEIHLGPIITWEIGAVILIAVQFCISICERERWGPRVARSIPRSWLLRPLAFLFYTGSGGGITLMVLLTLATLLGASFWIEGMVRRLSFASPGLEDARLKLDVMTAVSLFTYCYGMTAVLVRAHVLAGQLKPTFTWLVGLLLFGMGSAIPAFIAFLISSDQMRRGTDGGWWILPNPFMAIYELVWYSGSYRSKEDFRTLCFWFLGTWAFLATVLSLSWYIRQVNHFHPPEKKKKKREIEYAVVALIESAPPVTAG